MFYVNVLPMDFDKPFVSSTVTEVPMNGIIYLVRPIIPRIALDRADECTAFESAPPVVIACGAGE
jgi:hypothetical protein